MRVRLICFVHELLNDSTENWTNWQQLFYCSHIQLFRERLSEKLCTWQSRKVIWDMINALFLTLQLSNLLLLLSFSTRKHMSMASRAILWHFFWKKVNSKSPTLPFGIVACTFSDNLSWNSCIRDSSWASNKCIYHGLYLFFGVLHGMLFYFFISGRMIYLSCSHLYSFASYDRPYALKIKYPVTRGFS